MSITDRNRLFVEMSLLWLLVVPAGAGQASATDSTPAPHGEITELLRNAKIVDPSYKLTATISGDEIVVTTQRKPKSNDNECKIEAVLIGKTAFDAVKTGPQRTKVLFFDYDKNAISEVTVKRAEVRLFGEGELSEKELLASLELRSSESTETSAGPSVVPGPLQPNRVMALERIGRLKEHGTNVSAFMNLFAQVEEAANTGMPDLVRQRLDELNDKLKEQERTASGMEETENALRTGQDKPWTSPWASMTSAPSQPTRRLPKLPHVKRAQKQLPQQ